MLRTIYTFKAWENANCVLGRRDQQPEKDTYLSCTLAVSGNTILYVLFKCQDHRTVRLRVVPVLAHSRPWLTSA